MSRARWVAVLVLVPAVACGLGLGRPPAADKPEPWFVDVTDKVGLDFVHDAGPVDGKYFMPQIVGSGAALFDFDGDGRLDLYLLNNGGPKGRPNQLYRQRPDGTFENVSKGSGLDFSGYCMGVAVGDVNNDGRPDVLVTLYGGVKLFLNQGGGKFRDVTAEAGLNNPGWATSAAFVDYDRDGWLDLVVVNYVDYDPTWPCKGPDGRPDYCAAKVFKGTATRLFRNRGGVRFEDVTVRAGLGRSVGPGLGVVCADFNGDGWPDVLVANDGQANRLWINQRDGTFKEEALLRGVALDSRGVARGNRGLALADVDGDGLVDVLVTGDAGEGPALWRQRPRGQFIEATVTSGLTGRASGFGVVLADFDNDGSPDLVLANGWAGRGKPAVGGKLDRFWRPYAERNQLFANDGKGRFRDVSAANAPFCGEPAVWRGLVVGDVDRDGKLDLLVTSVAGRARLFRNVAAKSGHWLSVAAFDPRLKRDAYGAEVTVEAGGRRLHALINPGQGYLCSQPPRAHFGLGKANRVDAIRVRWPDGAVEAFPGVAADRSVVLRKGDGRRP
jgi:hypothetical protein